MKTGNWYLVNVKLTKVGDIEETLTKRLNQLGIRRQVDAAGVVEAAEKEIAKILPREDFEVISFKNGTLKVFTASSPAANELQLSSAKIHKTSPSIKRIAPVSALDGEKS